MTAGAMRRAVSASDDRDSHSVARMKKTGRSRRDGRRFVGDCAQDSGVLRTDESANWGVNYDLFFSGKPSDRLLGRLDTLAPQRFDHAGHFAASRW